MYEAVIQFEFCAYATPGSHLVQAQRVDPSRCLHTSKSGRYQGSFRDADAAKIALRSFAKLYNLIVSFIFLSQNAYKLRSQENRIDQNDSYQVGWNNPHRRRDHNRKMKFRHCVSADRAILKYYILEWTLLCLLHA